MRRREGSRAGGRAEGPEGAPGAQATAVWGCPGLQETGVGAGSQVPAHELSLYIRTVTCVPQSAGGRGLGLRGP